MTSPINLASEDTKRQWRITRMVQDKQAAPLIIGQSAEQSLTTPPEWQAHVSADEYHDAMHTAAIIPLVLASALVGILFAVIVIAWLLGPMW